MGRVCVICSVFIFSSLSIAQMRPAYSHPWHAMPNSVNAQLSGYSVQDSIRILAIMVEFEKDNDDRTTGDGTFQLTGSAAQIDPPPHDSIYFKNKIRFVKNYFRRVSNGKLSITDTLYGRIVLSKQISEYSPLNSNDNTRLVELARESWLIADSLYPEINFSRYDVFLVFHAGPGRDLDLVGTLGYNPAPFDIPSLYLDSTVITSVQGTPNGIPVDSGNYFIKNTVILPETESRVFYTGSGDELLQLSINGLFAASLGSYLGLPDLFNTETGRSGIGQFGLMDGAAIFAYNGLFPPEPCAWEKIALGWVIPITVESSTENISVPAVGLTEFSIDTIYKIPISQTEYFLLENRNRDPHRNGQTLTVVQDNLDVIKHFGNDTTGFDYLDVSGIHGSVVDVEDYDWAVIGYADGTGNYDGGGILIWHINENVIEAGLYSNSVNIDENHRGVDLEEADGSEDIGQYYEFLTPGSGTEYGSPLDCWFGGNSTPLYKNIFNYSSFPNSNSYSGAASLVTIRDFSERAPLMSVSVEIGSQILRRDTALHKKFGSSNTFPTSAGNRLYIPTESGLFAIQSSGQDLVKNTAGLFSAAANIGEVAVYHMPASEIVAGLKNDTLIVFRLDSLYGPDPFDSIIVIEKKYGQIFTTPPCIAELDSLSILAGTELGTLFQFNISGDTISKRTIGNLPISSIALLPTSSSTKPNEYFFTSGNQVFGEQSSVYLPASSNSWLLAAAVSPSGNYIVAAEKAGNKIVTFSQSLSKIFEITVQGSSIQELAIADIDGDGEKDIIVLTLTHLTVLNRAGFLMDGFPIQVRVNSEFTGTPLIVDFNSDSRYEIILFTNDGEMWVYNQDGKLHSGFPIQVTSPGKVFSMAYLSPSDILGIAILSDKDSVSAFLTSTLATSTSLAWWQHLGDERHGNVQWTQTTLKVNQEFLPASRVYNWPNPVYGHSTQIRYYTSENADVIVTIIDLSGVKIAELRGKGTGGMDNEITWDVSNIQSGVYFARVEARSISKSEVAFVKIAIVK